MKSENEKIPSPKEIEKEISDFLSKKFGGSVKMLSPKVLPQKLAAEETDESAKKQTERFQFDLKPEELIAYLDQYVVKQENAKAVLATKICTHFNRIKRSFNVSDNISPMVGGIKNNVLMIGPTGVGKTYIIKLIANKIGVPFVKGDATKFSETGYVGGDVEDLVRDLVREANDDIELAEYGIIYIDEIDKIASSRNLIGADISRTGVQRALLKPMEETEVELKVPHDPISMFQEIEHYRKTGDREKRTVNTKNILFIMSGAFNDLPKIINKRLISQSIGFGAQITNAEKDVDVLSQVKSEDLIAYGFESEFVGRLPVRAVFDILSENDLFDILQNPNNPIILGKKLDFAAYGIDVNFEENVLHRLAQNAYDENTGARGLVSAVEKALLQFEKRLPSVNLKKFPVTNKIMETPEDSLEFLSSPEHANQISNEFEKLKESEKTHIQKYLTQNRTNFASKYGLPLTEPQIKILSLFYVTETMDINNVIKKVKSLYDEIKKIELYFFKKHGINIVLEEDAIIFVLTEIANKTQTIDDFQKKIENDFEHGLKLVREKTGKNRFFITRKALNSPGSFLSDLIKQEITHLK